MDTKLQGVQIGQLTQKRKIDTKGPHIESKSP